MLHIFIARQMHKITAKFFAAKPIRPPNSQWHFVEHLACTHTAPFSTAEQQKLSSSPPQNISTALSFLQTSCGLSAAAAFAIADKFKNIKSVKNIESVVEALRQFSFSNRNIVALVSRCPAILNSNAEKIVKPKLEFYGRIGIPSKTISLNPQLLYTSLQSRLLPNFELIKSVLPNDEERRKLLRNSPTVLMRNLEKDMIPRINNLLEYGVTELVMTTLIVQYSRCFFNSNQNFEEACEEIKLMGISPSSVIFARALGVFAQMTKGLRLKKFDNYKDLGWSKDQLIQAFIRYPFCMAISDEKARRNVQFFKEKLDWGPEHLSVNPSLLCYSLEKRLIPRYTALRILASKGLIKDKIPSLRCFMMSEKMFADKYLTKYQDEAPELLNVLKSTKRNKKTL